MNYKESGLELKTENLKALKIWRWMIDVDTFVSDEYRDMSGELALLLLETLTEENERDEDD